MSDYIIINDDLRTMQIPSSIVLLGVESDDDVNKIQFQMPKEYCGFDLSTFSVRVNYMNANGDGDIYIADDITVDGDNMTFSWLVGRNACKYKGNTKFIVCLKLFDGDVVVKEFNTTVYSLPVLEGLETTEAVEQQNADIIQYLINLIEQSGGADLSNYYTKQEVDELIPTKLPNPEKLTINGSEYDGSESVDLTIEASSEIVKSAEGKVIHINDAVPEEAIQSLALYDEDDTQLSEGTIVITNKNLFRIDELAAQVVSKGITFTKNADGSITCNGTSTGTYPMTSCTLDKNMFEIGKTYTLSTGKNSGFTYCQLIMNYADGTTDYIVARNSPRAFTISKEVSSCTASVQLTDSGVTVSNETVYPMLEIGSTASAFVNNTYTEINFDGSVMPVLPAAICNVWSNDDVVASMTMQYEADTVLGKVDDYANENLHVALTAASVAAQHDGARTVSLVSVDEANSTLDIIDEYVEDKKEEIDEYIAEVEGELGETVAQHTEQISTLQGKTSALQKQVDNILEAEDLLRTVDYHDGENAVPANVSRYGEVSVLKGRSRVKNMQINPNASSTASSVGIIRNNLDGTFTITGTSPYTDYLIFDIEPIIGHVYLFAYYLSKAVSIGIDGVLCGFNSGGYGRYNIPSGIVFTENQSEKFAIRVAGGYDASGLVITPILVDLTKYFNGNIPTGLDIAMIQQKYPELLIPSDYDTGSIVKTTYNAVKMVGFNRFDKTKITTGKIIDYLGNIVDGSGLAVSDFMPIKPETSYYLKSTPISNVYQVHYYDANKNWIGRALGSTSNTDFNALAGAYFVRINVYINNVDDENFDLHDSTRDGTVLPYHEDILTLPEPVVLGSAGNVAEEYDLETGKKTNPIGSVVYDGSSDEAWQIYGSMQRFYIYRTDIKINPSSILANLCCNNLIPKRKDLIDQSTDKAVGVENVAFVVRIDSTITTVEQLRTWLASNPVTIYYEPATPAEDTQLAVVDDPFVEVESGGTIEPVQTQETKIDGAMTVTYVNKVTA